MVTATILAVLPTRNTLAGSGTMPTVSNVAGTVSTGQILTITGTNMVSEDRTNWNTFFTSHPSASGFEGANPAADGYSGIGPSGGSYDSSVKLMGSKSIKFRAQGASVNCPTDNLGDYNAINATGGPDTDDLWLRLYARWTLNGGSWPTSHIKMLDSQGGGGAQQYYFQPAAGGGSLPAQFNAVWAEGAGNTSHLARIPSGTLENGRWYGFELHWKVDNAGGNIFAAWIDGTQVLNDAPPRTKHSLNFILMGLINLCGTGSTFNLDHWWDGFAISSTRVNLASVIEIGDSSNYATATKVYQTPQNLSDTSSQIKANLTGLGAGPYFMWVTNNRGERSAAFAL